MHDTVWRRLLSGFTGSSARLLVLVACSAGVAAGVGGAPAWAAASHTAYVVNTGSNTVTPVDTATNTAGTPISVGTAPSAVAITPDGKTAYVADTGSSTVTPIDTATDTAGTPITVGGRPDGIAITPDGKTAYVANYTLNTVIPIDIATSTVGTPIPVGQEPVGIAITPDGKTAYVANSGSDTVTPIDTATDTAGTAIPVGPSTILLVPWAIAITPDGKTAYVGDSGWSHVTPIDTATNTAGTSIPFVYVPSAIAISPDGKTAYVASHPSVFGGSNTVTPVDTATNTAGPAISVGTNPSGVALTPDGKTAYVANAGSNTVTPVDAATNTAGPAITVGSSPEALAITPDQPPVAAFSAFSAPAGQGSGFDASRSSDPDGTVASYHWDFGDGTTQGSASPWAAHTYATPGAYQVTLTVTDDAGCSTGMVFTGQTVFCNGSSAATITQTVLATGPCSDPVANGNRSVVTCGSGGVAQTWRVPEGVSSVALDAQGAQGGSSSLGSGAPGGESKGDLAVHPGETLTIVAGGAGGRPSGGSGGSGGYGGGAAGGSNGAGGAGGGGGSFVYDGSGTLVIAAGGGGGAGAVECANAPESGPGGGLVGGQGACFDAGSGGTQSAGGTSPDGTGASGGGPATSTSGVPVPGPGGAGSSSTFHAGGGGGGGYYGGAGGGNLSGGGGSGFISAAVTNGSTTSGAAPGPNGVVTITYATPTRPSITSKASATFNVGRAGSFTVMATGVPAPSLSESGTLPSGVRFVDNGAGTATLSGTPAAGTGGTYPVTITASTPLWPEISQQSFTLTVDQPAAITSAEHATSTVGQAAPAPGTRQTGPSAPAALTNLRVAPGTFSLTGRRVGRHCEKVTAANRRDRPCKRPLDLRLGYLLNMATTVTFTVTQRASGRTVTGRCVPPTKHNQRHRKCVRLVQLNGRLTRVSVAGANGFTWAGRIGGHTLGAGTYTMHAVPAGGRVQAATFTIVR